MFQSLVYIVSFLREETLTTIVNSRFCQQDGGLEVVSPRSTTKPINNNCKLMKVALGKFWIIIKGSRNPVKLKISGSLHRKT